MGVSNVYNQAKSNAIAAIKSNLTAKGTKKAGIPEHLRLTGSIFNAPGVKDSQSTPTIVGLNTRASLTELNQPPITRAQGSGSNSNPDNFGDIDNAADGKAAANSVDAQGQRVSALTNQAEGYTVQVSGYSSSAIKLNGQLIDANKNFISNNTKLQTRIKADNDKLDNINKENEQLQKDIDDAQNELDTLLARRSFSMGSSDGSSGSSEDQAKINELQVLIGSKVGTMQANGKVVYSLQRSQSRSLNQMQKINSAYIKTNQKHTKALQTQQNEDSKIIKVATEVEKYSALAQAGGQMLNLAGRGLVALGTAIGSTGWGAAVGAALVATGQVMGKIGTVVELVGQYGQTAANLTKTAAYAAEGNIMGAMQSAASAVQMGTAAVKGTTGLKAQFKAIDQTATEATNKIAANQIARDQVNKEQLTTLLAKENGIDIKNLKPEENITEMLKSKGIDVSELSGKDLETKMLNGDFGTTFTKDQIKNTKKGPLLNGMTTKEARQATAHNLRNHFNNDTLDGVTSNHNQNGRLKQLKNEATKRHEIDTKDADGNITGKTTTSQADLAFLEAQNDYHDAFRRNGYTVSSLDGTIYKNDKDVQQVTNQKEIKKIRKQIGKQAKTSFGNIKKSSTKSSTNWADNMNKFTQSFGSMAQMFGMMSGQGSMVGTVGSMPGISNMMGFGNSMMGMGNMRYVNNGMGYTGNTSNSTRKYQNPYATRHLTRGARA